MSEEGWFRRVWPSLVALLGTVGVIAVLLVVAGGEVETVDPGDAVDDAAVEDTGTPTPSGTDEQTAPATTPEPTAEPVRAPVVVLNQTTVQGLAARTAEALEGDGWEVVEIASFPSGVPQTTVYYPADLEDAAVAMEAEWDGIDRVRPVFSGLSEEALTVILAETDDPPVPAGG